jgi:HNH endonuclease
MSKRAANAAETQQLVKRVKYVQYDRDPLTPVHGYPKYRFLSDQKTIITSRGQIMKTWFGPEGYESTGLTHNGRKSQLKVHRLILLTFKGVPPNDSKKYTVDHIDKDPKNNALDNLRWATDHEQSKNRNHAKSNKGKLRPVIVKDPEGVITEFESVYLAIKSLPFATTLSVVYARIKSGKGLEGYLFSYPSPPDGDRREITDISVKGYYIYSNGLVLRADGSMTYGSLKNGYRKVWIGQSYYVHILVADAFVPCRSFSYDRVNHINGNKEDNRVENLEWTDAKGNGQHAHETGAIKGKQVRKLNLEGEEICIYKSLHEAGRDVSKSKSAFSAISAVCNRRKSSFVAYGYKWEYVC